MFMRHLMIRGLGLGASALLASCQSGNTQAPSHAMSPQAVRCDKCEVTWVKVSGRPPLGYNLVRHMECPDCRNSLSNFFATGKLEHHCNACGGNMVPCQEHWSRPHDGEK